MWKHHVEFCVLPMYNNVTHCSTNDTEAPNKIKRFSLYIILALLTSQCGTISFQCHTKHNVLFFITFLKAYVQEEDCITFCYYFQLYVISFAAKNP